jgi:MraZ protein
MFLGQFEHTIDDKGRMTIPSRYRELLDGGAYITRGFDENLMVLTAASFNEISESIRVTSVTDADARALKRWIFANASWVEVDKAGRILIPQWLRMNAGLEGNAMVVGVGEYFEIWQPERWTRHNEETLAAGQTASRFSSFNVPL